MKSLNKLNIVLIMSAADDIRKRFSRLLDRSGASYIFEREKTTALVRMLELNVKLMILDLQSADSSSIDFIRLIKRLRPRVSIIAVIPDVPKASIDFLTDSGARYCIIKPVEESQAASMVGELVGQK